jgi:hypothetical protein
MASRLAHVPRKKMSGEIGTLTSTAFFPEIPTRLFLIIEFENQPYLGCLVFTEAVFCQQLNAFLQDHLGRSIVEIGDMDLSHTFKLPGNTGAESWMTHFTSIA